jgi:hypothetical protein
MYEGAHEKQQREQRRQKQRASGSRMAKLLLEEYSDAPVEETFAGERGKHVVDFKIFTYARFIRRKTKEIRRGPHEARRRIFCAI